MQANNVIIESQRNGGVAISNVKRRGVIISVAAMNNVGNVEWRKWQ
jgi:hypothetical protein